MHRLNIIKSIVIGMLCSAKFYGGDGDSGARSAINRKDDLYQRFSRYSKIDSEFRGKLLKALDGKLNDTSTPILCPLCPLLLEHLQFPVVVISFQSQEQDVVPLIVFQKCYVALASRDINAAKPNGILTADGVPMNHDGSKVLIDDMFLLLWKRDGQVEFKFAVGEQGARTNPIYQINVPIPFPELDKLRLYKIDSDSVALLERFKGHALLSIESIGLRFYDEKISLFCLGSLDVKNIECAQIIHIGCDWLMVFNAGWLFSNNKIYWPFISGHKNFAILHYDDSGNPKAVIIKAVLTGPLHAQAFGTASFELSPVPIIGQNNLELLSRIQNTESGEICLAPPESMFANLKKKLAAFNPSNYHIIYPALVLLGIVVGNFSAKALG